MQISQSNCAHSRLVCLLDHELCLSPLLPVVGNWMIGHGGQVQGLCNFSSSMVLGIVSALGHGLCVEGVLWNLGVAICLGWVEFVLPFVSRTFIRLQYGRA
jgi:hypothetical protein